MRHYRYMTSGVCSRSITFGLEEGRLYDVMFEGGCNGNLKAVGKLVEGQDAAKIAATLRGNDCNGRGTSCADQLARAIDLALEEEKKA